MAKKRYRYGDKRMTQAEAKKWAPNPIFFDRATEKMTRYEVEQIVLRNAREIRFWVDQWERLARGQYQGRLTKRSLIIDANRMHDWRVGMEIMSGALGRPYLWEE